MANQTVVIAKVQVEGLHRWPEAFDAVAFLRETHRHVFHIEARAKVQHHDRDIEIIDLGRRIRTYLHDRYGDPMELGAMSCEMLAAELVEVFALHTCTVLEDGENGAEVQA